MKPHTQLCTTLYLFNMVQYSSQHSPSLLSMGGLFTLPTKSELIEQTKSSMSCLAVLGLLIGTMCPAPVTDNIVKFPPEAYVGSKMCYFNILPELKYPASFGFLSLCTQQFVFLLCSNTRFPGHCNDFTLSNQFRSRILVLTNLPYWRCLEG